MGLPVNQIIQGDAIKVLKKFPDESVDAVVTDPPYFLINSSGSGFMGKEWESINKSKGYRILCKSKDTVQSVVRFFLSMKVDLNTIEEISAQKNARMCGSVKSRLNKSNLNVLSVGKSSKEVHPKLRVNISSVQGIVLTKGEVLDMLKELSLSPISVIENLSENALFVVPYSYIRRRLKNIVVEDVLKLSIEKICREKEIRLSSMEEARIKGVIEGMIGGKLERLSTKETTTPVGYVESIVDERKYRYIISSHTNKQKIIQWITLLLFVLDAMPRSKMELWQSLIYQFHKNWAKEAYRVLKPGGYMLVFGGTRTYHRMVIAIEDAGFEIRDMILWLYSSGFPKSMDISKAIDKELGKLEEREVISIGRRQGKNPPHYMGRISDWREKSDVWEITALATPEAARWQGWGTALKPACEPIVLARKPISEKNIAQNMLKWGTGGLNIDVCRIPYKDEKDYKSAIFGKQTDIRGNKYCTNRPSDGYVYAEKVKPNPQGRFPADVILDEEVAKMLDEQTKGTRAEKPSYGGRRNRGTAFWGHGKEWENPNEPYLDSGGASRFFYVPKAGRDERFAYCRDCEEVLPQKAWQEHKDHNVEFHPTVKPLKLIEYLVRLVTPMDGIVLDPFIGTGATAVACEKLSRRWIGIEINPEYYEIARRRIEPYLKQRKLNEFEERDG
jgi:site-specific DNA-methyltransferase (adenine-specific)